MFTFLHQTDKFIITGDMAAQTFWQWSDDIKTKDDITPFDGTFLIFACFSVDCSNYSTGLTAVLRIRDV